MEGYSENRNINIDLVKIVACFIVIMTHCFLPYIAENGTISHDEINWD